MDNIIISNRAALQARIKELRLEKSAQEIEIKEHFKEFAASFNSFTLVKEYLHELAQDKEVQLDIGKVGLEVGTTFIIDKVLGRNNSIKGFLSSIVAEKISSSLIENNAPKIISFFSNLINSKK